MSEQVDINHLSRLIRALLKAHKTAREAETKGYDGIAEHWNNELNLIVKKLEDFAGPIQNG